MSYEDEIQLSSSKKDFLIVIEPAIRVTNWTLHSGNIYYNDFSISDSFIEYVSNVSSNGVKLSKVSSLPSSGQYFWDYQNKRLYINIGSNPSSSFIGVFFEIYCASKTYFERRDIEDINSETVYYEPRIISATIPEINQEDFLLYGSNSGNVSLNNKDASFYIYEYASFRKKKIKIFHFVNNEKTKIYSGFIDRIEIDDNQFQIFYNQLDFIFNEKFNSYLETGTDLEKGFFNLNDFPLLDPAREGYAIRHIYGKKDDLIPINIDYSDNNQTDNNRIFVVRSLGNKLHQLSNAVLASPSSTSTRIYVGSHFYQVNDSVNINGEYTSIVSIGSNYVDVFPAITPPSTGNILNRGTIGYVKIKDQNGVIYNLAYGRDYTESAMANNTLGFTLADNFESNHVGLTMFVPQAMAIFCRCYGKKHASINDSVYGNMTKANYILEDLLLNYAGVDPLDIDSVNFLSVSTVNLGISIPENLQTFNQTYREIINKINISTLGQMYQNQDNKFSYRLNGPMGSSEKNLDDSDLLSISVSYDGSNLYSHIRISYDFKEAPNGSLVSSTRRVSKISDLARFLHEDYNEIEIDTFILDEADANTIAERYKIIFEDWFRSYSMKVKTQLSSSIIGKIITIERNRMNGFNYNREIMRSKKMKIMALKKGLNSVEFTANPQNNIEDNSGGW